MTADSCQSPSTRSTAGRRGQQVFRMNVLIRKIGTEFEGSRLVKAAAADWHLAAQGSGICIRETKKGGKDNGRSSPIR